jgi:hypothetical protein
MCIYVGADQLRSVNGPNQRSLAMMVADAEQLDKQAVAADITGGELYSKFKLGCLEANVCQKNHQMTIRPWITRVLAPSVFSTTG